MTRRVIKVIYYPTHGGSVVHTYPATVIPKVLASGTLKITQREQVEIPVMEEGKTSDSKEIIKAPEVVLGVYTGNYIMLRLKE